MDGSGLAPPLFRVAGLAQDRAPTVHGGQTGPSGNGGVARLTTFFRPGALARLASAQAGLFTRTQARECGYSNYQIRRRLADGHWCAVLGPVLASASTALELPLFDRAASLAVPGGVLAGPSAARVHSIPVAEPGLYLAVTGPGRRALPGVRFLRDPLPPAEIEMVDHVAVTNQVRTVFDCVRLLPDDQATALLDQALRQRWITWDEFTTRARTYTGRRGAPRLTTLAGTGKPPPAGLQRQ